MTRLRQWLTHPPEDDPHGVTGGQMLGVYGLMLMFFLTGG